MVGGDTAAWVRSDDGSNIVAGDVKKGREILDIWFVKLNDFVRARMKYDRYSRGLSVSDIEDNILSYIRMVTDTELFYDSKNPPPPPSSCSRCVNNDGYGSHAANNFSSLIPYLSLSPSSLLTQLPLHVNTYLDKYLLGFYLSMSFDLNIVFPRSSQSADGLADGYG